MGFFTKRVNEEKGTYPLALKAMSKVEEKFPNIHEALCGTVDEVGSYLVHPMSLKIWTQDGQCLFCFTSRESEETFFGCVKHPVDAMESIEMALIDGDVKPVPNKYKSTAISY